MWCINNKEELEKWGTKQRGKKTKNMKEGRKRVGKRPAVWQEREKYHDFPEDDDYDEMFRWEDLAEDLGWPSGYDPWSD